MENLVIDILRTRYGKSDVALFYDTSKGKFHDFSVLARNLRSKKADFGHVTSNFDKIMNDVNEFRETGNASAHSIDANLTIEHFTKDRQRINHTVNAMLRILDNL